MLIGYFKPYKGYKGTIEYSIENGYHGKIICKDLVNYESNNVENLYEEFKSAIDVGKRHGNSVIYKINSKDMYDNGYKFYLSENNVWLIEKVPVDFIERID